MISFSSNLETSSYTSVKANHHQPSSVPRVTVPQNTWDPLYDYVRYGHGQEQDHVLQCIFLQQSIH